MCGICGFLSTGLDDRAAVTLQAMVDQLRHRGPDDAGIWLDPAAGVALGHTRLAVVDLSPAGHQPMLSADGRWVISYNGEIYNAGELRADLRARGSQLAGHSDTEVLVEAIAAWGVAAVLDACQRHVRVRALGPAERRLHPGARPDRQEAAILRPRRRRLSFASELKALRAHPALRRDRPGCAGPVPALRLAARTALDLSRRAQAAAPARCLELGPDDAALLGAAALLVGARTAAKPLAADPFTGSLDEARRRSRTLLTDSVRRRMVADVPLGALLSGGIDSTLVVALMQRSAASRCGRSRSAFSEPEWDEAPAARAMAEHLGTAHTELYVTRRRRPGGHPRSAADLRRAVRRPLRNCRRPWSAGWPARR